MELSAISGYWNKLLQSTNMLNEKTKRFCEEYVTDLNGKQAAIRSGYSAKTAEVQASRLLSNAKVKAYISELRKKQMERNELSADKIIKELISLGFWSIKDFLDEKNCVKDLSKMDKSVLRPVIGIKVTETKIGKVTEVKTELKLVDKRATLVDLGRHLGIFKEDNQQKAPVPPAQLTDSQFEKLLVAARETTTNTSK